MTEEERQVLEATLGHHFRQPEWLERALTHRSRKEGSGVGHGPDNERLEFFGDGVLGLIAGEHLFANFPDWTAGMLSKGKARLVSTRSIQQAAQRMGLGRHLRLGRGEEKTGGREKRNLLADAYEAVVAAIYLDAGLEAATRFVRRSLLEPAVAEQAGSLDQADHKSALQEWLQQRGRGRVEYRVVEETGPQHRKTFLVEARLAGETLASSAGLTKKEAEQAAARLALAHLQAKQGSQ